MAKRNEPFRSTVRQEYELDKTAALIIKLMTQNVSLCISWKRGCWWMENKQQEMQPNIYMRWGIYWKRTEKQEWVISPKYSDHGEEDRTDTVAWHLTAEQTDLTTPGHSISPSWQSGSGWGRVLLTTAPHWAGMWKKAQQRETRIKAASSEGDKTKPMGDDSAGNQEISTNY